jgi:hypothetical protein
MLNNLHQLEADLWEAAEKLGVNSRLTATGDVFGRICEYFL